MDHQQPLASAGKTSGAGLVGRRNELGEIRRSISATSGSTLGFVIAGQTGIGKSLLLDEAANLARELGSSVLRIASRNSICDLSTFRNRMQGDVRRRPGIVIVDDLNLVQGGEIAEILSQIESSGLKLGASINIDSPISRTVRSFWRSGKVVRVDLGPLTPIESRRVAQAMSGGGLAKSDITEIARISGGVPLLIREMTLSFGATEGRRTSISGPAFNDSQIERLRPDGLGALEGRLLEAMEFLSLAEPVDVAVCEEEIDGADLADLEERGMIVMDPASGAAPAVRIRNQLVAEYLRATVKPFKRRMYLDRWLRAKPFGEQRGAELRKTIGWMVSSGRQVEEATVQAAVEDALSDHDLASADNLSRYSVLSHGTSGSIISRIKVLVSSGQHDTLFREVDRFYGETSDYPADVSYWIARARMLNGEFDAAEELLQCLPAEQAALLQGMLHYLRGEYQQSLAALEPLARWSTAAQHIEAAVFAMACHCHQGRPTRAIEIHREVTELYGESPKEWTLNGDSMTELLASALHDLGELRQSESILRGEYSKAGAVLDSRTEPQRGLALGFNLYEQGKVRQAMNLYSFDPSYSVGWLHWHNRARVNTVLAAAALPLGECEGHLADDLSDIEGTNFDIYLSAALAWRERRSSNHEAAHRIISEGIARARKAGGSADVAIGIHEMARMGFQLADTAVLGSVPVEGRFLRARLDYAKGMSAKDDRILGSAARVFSELGANLYAAESYSEIAQIHRRRGKKKSATAATIQAQELLRGLGPLDTPALNLLKYSEPLTDRERLMAEMAAKGLSDKEIATNLTLSARTVSNTLYRLYRKLGISSRRELMSHLERYSL